MRQLQSPFKFLDSYNKNDREVFFGRESEIETLYEFVYKTNLLLVYGQSGTGKSSLIQCGLVNKFKETDWFDIHIRRKQNINENLHEELRKSALTPFENSFSLEEKLESIFLDYFKPIYLIFDQFEELYILGSNDERKEFIAGIKEIINSSVKCTVIIVMREEYIAHLYDFEKEIPQLFDKRLRVESMSVANVKNVIKESTAKFNIQLDTPDQTVSKIIENISDQKSGIQLSYLQIYLDRLFREANYNNTSPNKEIIFDTSLVNQVGSINKVLTEFLDTQTNNIQSELEQNHTDVLPTAVQMLLNEFVTLDGTKKPLKKEEINIPNVNSEHVEFCLSQLESARILRLVDNYYELAHDTIALHIADHREGDEVALLEIEKLIKDRFDAYSTTKTLLNPKELSLVSNFEKKLKEQNKFTPDIWGFIHHSKQKYKRRKKLRAALISAILLVLSSTTIFALYKQSVAETALQKLEAAEIQKEQDRRKAYDDYYLYMDQGEAALANLDFSAAQAHYETALKIANQYEYVNEIRKAEIGVEKSRIKSGNVNQFNTLIKDGDLLFELGGSNYVASLQKYRDARLLNVNNELTDEKILKVESHLPTVFEDLKSRGLKHLKVNGYQYALQEFKSASLIKPEDRLIKDLIQQCVNNLKN